MTLDLTKLVWNTKNDADCRCTDFRRLDCIHIRWTEGKGAEVIND